MANTAQAKRLLVVRNTTKLLSSVQLMTCSELKTLNASAGTTPVHNNVSLKILEVFATSISSSYLASSSHSSNFGNFERSEVVMNDDDKWLGMRTKKKRLTQYIRR